VARPPTLERRVLDVLWAAERPLTVREVLDAMAEDGGPTLAYTTVQTVMNRLVRKRVLGRDDGVSPHRYAPVRSRDDHAAKLIMDILDVSPDRGSVLLRLAEQVGADDADGLRQALQRRSGPSTDSPRDGGPA